MPINFQTDHFRDVRVSGGGCACIRGGVPVSVPLFFLIFLNASHTAPSILLSTPWSYVTDGIPAGTDFSKSTNFNFINNSFSSFKYLNILISLVNVYNHPIIIHIFQNFQKSLNFIIHLSSQTGAMDHTQSVGKV